MEKFFFSLSSCCCWCYVCWSIQWNFILLLQNDAIAPFVHVREQCSIWFVLCVYVWMCVGLSVGMGFIFTFIRWAVEALLTSSLASLYISVSSRIAMCLHTLHTAYEYKYRFSQWNFLGSFFSICSTAVCRTSRRWIHWAYENVHLFHPFAIGFHSSACSP